MYSHMTTWLQMTMTCQNVQSHDHIITYYSTGKNVQSHDNIITNNNTMLECTVTWLHNYIYQYHVRMYSHMTT
jgi:hypothetical protein